MISGSRLVLAAALCLSGVVPVLAADVPAASKETILIPQTVYVGDRARLIVPLKSFDAATIGAPLVLDVAERMPRSKDAVILRVELQRFEGGWRTLVDFVAYAPGTVELPRIEIGGVVLSGLSATIASILETEGDVAELAPLALTLSAPGTALLVYGAVFFLIVTALVVAFVLVRGPTLLREALARRRRGLVARSMRRVAARLAENVASMESSEFLSILFSELRSYLTYRTGVNYIALTPRELPEAVAAEPNGSEAFRNSCIRLEVGDGTYLEKLFRWGDGVRFGGVIASTPELREALIRVVALVEKIEGELNEEIGRVSR